HRWSCIPGPGLRPWTCACRPRSACDASRLRSSPASLPGAGLGIGRRLESEEQRTGPPCARDLAGDHRKAGEGAPLEFVLTIGGRDNPVLDALVFPGQHRAGRRPIIAVVDRKSTRLNSSHVKISYAVFCLKKKNRNGSFCY